MIFISQLDSTNKRRHTPCKRAIEFKFVRPLKYKTYINNSCVIIILFIRDRNWRFSR